MEFVGKFDVNVVDERKIEYVRRRNNQGTCTDERKHCDETKLHNLLLATSGLALGSGRKLIGCWVIGWVKIKSCCPASNIHTYDIIYFNCYNVSLRKVIFIYPLVSTNSSLPVNRIK